MRYKLPNSSSLVKALSSITDEISEPELELLKRHYHAPARRTTATKLARALGYKNYGGSNLIYGILARKVADYLKLPKPESVRIEIFVDFIMPGEERNEHIIWVMRPELATALRKLKWV